MSRPLRLSIIIAMLAICSPPLFASPIVIDFDGLAELDRVTTQFPRLTFANATVLTAGSLLNDLEFPPHSGQNAVTDDGGAVSIDFASPVISVGGYFTYLAPVQLAAFDS